MDDTADGDVGILPVAIAEECEQHSCPFYLCGKSFPQKDDVQEHMKAAGHIPCLHCESVVLGGSLQAKRIFPSQRLLERHQRLIHNDLFPSAGDEKALVDKQGPIADLFDVCLNNVFSFLPGVSLCQAETVCSRWRAMVTGPKADGFWQQIVEQFHHDEHLRRTRTPSPAARSRDKKDKSETADGKEAKGDAKDGKTDAEAAAPRRKAKLSRKAQRGDVKWKEAFKQRYVMYLFTPWTFPAAICDQVYDLQCRAHGVHVS